MRRSTIRVMYVSLALCVAGLTSAHAAPPDLIPGAARWEWTLGTGKNAEMGTFKGYQDGTIKHGTAQKLVGNWKPVGTDSIHVKFTDGPLHGEVTLKRTVAKIITFEGKLNKKGKDEKLVVRLYKD